MAVSFTVGRFVGERGAFLTLVEDDDFGDGHAFTLFREGLGGMSASLTPNRVLTM
jgi:hypothetical protein